MSLDSFLMTHRTFEIINMSFIRSTRTFRRAKLASYSGYPVILGSENDRRVFKSVSANYIC